MTLETRLSRNDAVGDLQGVVILLHGGDDVASGPQEVKPWDLGYLRINVLRQSVQGLLARRGLALWTLKFRNATWLADPENPGITQEDDLDQVLDLIALEYPQAPVVLIGHSMGARVAIRRAGRSEVVGVIGLAPWWPQEESPAPLLGKHVAVAYNPKDPVVPRSEIETFVGRLQAANVAVEVLPVGERGPGGLSAHGLLWDPLGLNSFIIRQARRMVRLGEKD